MSNRHSEEHVVDEKALSSEERIASRMPITIRSMKEPEVDAVAGVHAAVFPRQIASGQWVWANFRAFPRIRYFVAEEAGEVLGYIQWIEKAGFRRDAVLELEQIGVLPQHQGRGIGSALILESLAAVKEDLAGRGSTLKSVLVTTRTDNGAQRLYEKILGATPVAVIEDLYSADEAIMLARRPLGSAQVRQPPAKEHD